MLRLLLLLLATATTPLHATSTSTQQRHRTSYTPDDSGDLRAQLAQLQDRVARLEDAEYKDHGLTSLDKVRATGWTRDEYRAQREKGMEKGAVDDVPLWVLPTPKARQ